MKKQLLLVLSLLSLSSYCFSQAANKKILFVIDSIPLLNTPQEWNQILDEDISDIRVVDHKDSLKLLGYEDLDGITYIFTKEYRNRPDSLKNIPSMNQMEVRDAVWYRNGYPYTGKYIDYYNNGKKQNEGSLVNGKLDGELNVYYKTGIKRSTTNYKQGARDGNWTDYYQNGTLRSTSEFINDKRTRTGKSYFIYGQIMQELKLKNATRYDTSITYYSSGKVREIKMTKTGEFYPDKTEEKLNYHSTMFYEHLRVGDLRAANKNFYEIWKIDSLNIDTYFREGVLLVAEFRFNDAITCFDKALAIEPLMREALEQRGLSIIKAHKFSKRDGSTQQKGNIPVTLDDFMLLSEQDKSRVCTDFILSDMIDPGVNYNNKMVPEAILQYCIKKSGR